MVASKKVRVCIAGAVKIGANSGDKMMKDNSLEGVGERIGHQPNYN